MIAAQASVGMMGNIGNDGDAPSKGAASECIHTGQSLTVGPPVLQAWATLEWHQGNIAAARWLFQQGADTSKAHAPLLASWANMEVSISFLHLPEAARLTQVV